MTREEAIEIIERNLEVSSWRYSELFSEALEMAIKALEQEPCDVPDINVGDMISRQAVLNAMYELCDTGETLKENPWRDNPHIDAITDAIEDLPPVNPQPKTGHWDSRTCKCSKCGYQITFSEYAEHKYKYCPNCGAKVG